MAQQSWPSPAHNNRAATDIEYEMLAAFFSGDGVYGDPTEPAVATAGIGLTVNIRADVFGSLRGHGWTSGTTGAILNVTPNTSGQTRVDRVVLRLDRTAWTVRAVVKAGTPGAGPPTLTTGDGFNTYEALISNVTVLNGANTVTVVRGERYVGSRIRPTRSTAQTNPNLKLGDVLWEVDTKRLLLYDGDALRTIYSDPGEVVVNSPLLSWKNNIDCVLQEKNGTVHCRFGSFTRTATGTLPSGTESRLPVLIPASYRHPTRDQYGVAMTGGEIARFIIYSGNSDLPGQVWLTNKPNIPSGQFLLPISGNSWVV
ncbi:hypothetical protein [Streptomyces hirsutus]|uniref:hypothetical protein n=1 Tax=Streptomyces hirsutus TaxID=35620 RepID=UPI00367946E6